MLFISIAVFILAIPMKETYKPIILKRRAKKLGITVPEADTQPTKASKKLLVQRLVRPMHLLVTEVCHCPAPTHTLGYTNIK